MNSKAYEEAVKRKDQQIDQLKKEKEVLKLKKRINRLQNRKKK